MRYIIKCYTTYEIECNNDQDALKLYNNGLWDFTDQTDEQPIEIGKINSEGEYQTVSDD